MNNNESKRMQLMAVIERGDGDAKKNWWSKIGVAFQNADGSWNLRFDYLPANMAVTTIQMREFTARPQEAPAQE